MLSIALSLSLYQAIYVSKCLKEQQPKISKQERREREEKIN
jgi:hypothetical protein